MSSRSFPIRPRSSAAPSGVVRCAPDERPASESLGEPRDGLTGGTSRTLVQSARTCGGASTHRDAIDRSRGGPLASDRRDPSRYHPRAVAEWIYFIPPPREDFAATMTDEENAVWAEHFVRFQQLLREGIIVLVGPTLGRHNTGIAIFEAPDEAAARRIMEEDPVIAGGYARGELRPFRISLLRGRDN